MNRPQYPTSIAGASMADCAKATCERRLSEVEEQLGILSKNRIHLADAIGTLQSRLGPVLMPDLAVNKDASPMPPDPAICPLASSLRDANKDIRNMVMALEQLVGRLGV